MNKQEKLLLLLAVLIATAIHFLPVLLGEYASERAVRRLKLRFNAELTSGKGCSERLAYLKILINNYASVEDKRIFLEKDPERLRAAVDALEIRSTRRWQRMTPQFYVAVIGPIIMPVMVYAIKGLLR